MEHDAKLTHHMDRNMRRCNREDVRALPSEHVPRGSNSKRVKRTRRVLLLFLFLMSSITIGLFVRNDRTASAATARHIVIITGFPAEDFRRAKFSSQTTARLLPQPLLKTDGSTSFSDLDITAQDSLFGVPLNQLAANIRRSSERFNTIELDQVLRRERGPPSYVYSEGRRDAAEHPEDKLKTVKVKFFVYCSKLDDLTRLSALTAALTGIRLECITYDWKRFSFINRFAPIVGYLLASENHTYFDNPLDKLHDGDVVTLADSDVLYSGDADVLTTLRAFASVTAHSAAEHQRMTTRDPREPAHSVRWTRYARDVRTGSALAPLVVQGETYCWLQGLGNSDPCENHFRNIFGLHQSFLKQQRYYREARETATGGARRSVGQNDTYAEGRHAVASNGHSRVFKLGGGFIMARVWALRRTLLAAQNLAHTLPNCREGECRYPIPESPRHKVGAHRTDANDQGYLGILYLLNRLHEYQTGGPLAIQYDEMGDGATTSASSVLTTTERRQARRSNTVYDLLGYTSHIPSGAPDTDGASLRLPHALMMVDSHNVFAQVIHNLNAWDTGHAVYRFNASWIPGAHRIALHRDALRPYDTEMALRFEERRRRAMHSSSSPSSAVKLHQPLPPLARSPLGNLLHENVFVLNSQEHSYSCRADEAEVYGTCSSLSFLRETALVRADSAVSFPAQSERVHTRPFVWHLPGSDKLDVLSHYLYLLPQLYPLLHPLVNHTRAACELARLTELLPPVRVWRLVGECGDVDAYRGGEGTGRAVTEELIWRSTRELGCLPAAAPDLVPLGDSGKDAELLWAARGRVKPGGRR